MEENGPTQAIQAYSRITIRSIEISPLQDIRITPQGRVRVREFIAEFIEDVGNTFWFY